MPDQEIAAFQAAVQSHGDEDIRLDALDNAIWRVRSDREVTHAAFRIYSTIVTHAKMRDRCCYIGLDQLAALAGISRRNVVSDAIAELESVGIVAALRFFDASLGPASSKRTFVTPICQPADRTSATISMVMSRVKAQVIEGRGQDAERKRSGRRIAGSKTIFAADVRSADADVHSTDADVSTPDVRSADVDVRILDVDVRSTDVDVQISDAERPHPRCRYSIKGTSHLRAEEISEPTAHGCAGETGPEAGRGIDFGSTVFEEEVAPLPVVESTPSDGPDSRSTSTALMVIPAATLTPVADDELEPIDEQRHFRDSTGEVLILKDHSIEARLPGAKPERVGVALLRKDNRTAKVADLIEFGFGIACAWLSDHLDRDGKPVRLASRIRFAVKHDFDQWMSKKTAGAVAAIAGPKADKTDAAIAAAAHSRGVELTAGARAFLRDLMAMPLPFGVESDNWLDGAVEALAGDRVTDEVAAALKGALTAEVSIKARPTPKELRNVLDKAVEHIRLVAERYGPGGWMMVWAAAFNRYDAAEIALRSARDAAPGLIAAGLPVDPAFDPGEVAVGIFTVKSVSAADLGGGYDTDRDPVMRYAYLTDGERWPSDFAPDEKFRPRDTNAPAFKWPTPPPPKPFKKQNY
ncbi:MAG: hypothetical protein ACOYLQ_08010 [Hyphomicrobiaceae bacterium]